MDMTITAKVQIYPSNEQAECLLRTMDVYRSACNFVSGYVFKTHDLSQYSLNKQLYYQIRDVFGLSSQITQSVLKTVIAKYKTIRTNQHEWLKPDFKIPQLDLLWNRDYSLRKDCFSVSSLAGRLKIPYEIKGMEKYFDKSKYSFGTAKLVYKHKKYFLHIPVSFEVCDSKLEDISNVVGIDRGINFLIATYDSNGKSGFVSGRTVKQKRSQYKAVRQQLQMCKTSSARRRLKAIGSRENRWMNDVNHCVSKALVNKYDSHTLFVLEDLSGVRHATEHVRKKDRYVSVSWSYYDLEQKIKYKAMKHGCSVITVNPVNPAYTSQTCPKCGHTERNNRNKKIHLFICKNCGYKSNDDRIGAMNLYRKGIDYLVPDTVQSE